MLLSSALTLYCIGRAEDHRPSQTIVMKLPAIAILITGIAMLLACQAPKKLYRLRTMDEFNINAGNRFIEQIQYLTAINEISIVDTKANGNDFVVNGQSVFLDTVQPDQPNYYNIRKRARELNVNADSLVNCLRTFYQVNVNDFSRDSNYFRFRVVVGLTTNKGYLYLNNISSRVGDTLPATAVRNSDFHFRVVLTKQLDNHWFEYTETR